MPRLDVATTSQAVPLFSKARFLGKANRAKCLLVFRGGEFPPPPINSLDDGHRQWPSGIEDSGLEPRGPVSLGASFILPGGTLGGR